MQLNQLGIILLTLLLGSMPIAQAQETNGELPYVFSRLGQVKGFPRKEILDIIDSPKGLLISTYNSIVTHNGKTYTTIKKADTNQKPFAYNRIYYEDKANYIYGWSLKEGYNLIYPQEKKIANFTAIKQDNDTIIGIDKNGVIQHISLNGKEIYLSEETGIKHPKKILKTNNYHYVATNDSLYQINRKTKERIGVLEGETQLLRYDPFNQKVIAITWRINNINEVTKEKDIYYFPHKSSKETPLVCMDMYIYSDGKYLIANEDGLYIKEGETFSLYNGTNCPLPAFISRIFYNKAENTFYLGSHNREVIKLSEKIGKSYLADKKGSQSLTGITKDAQGNIFTSVMGDLLEHRTDGTLITHELFENKRISSLNIIDNKLLIATWDKFLYEFKNGQIIQLGDYSAVGSITGIDRDSQQRTWYLSRFGIYYNYPEQEIQKLEGVNEKCVSFYERKDGTICIGCESTFYILSKEQEILEAYGRDKGLRGMEVRSFYEDNNNELWIGTYGGGLFLLKNKELISINDYSNCKLDADIFTLAPHKDKLYVSTIDGIYAVKIKDLQSFSRHELDYLIPERFGSEIGIIDSEFNGGFHKNWVKHKDKLYLPSIQGLVEFNLSLDSAKINPSPIVFIQSLLVNDTLIDLHSTNKFKRNTHTIKLEFFSPYFTEKANTHYQYRINEGKKVSKWSQPLKESELSLKMLPPGKYSLQIRALNSNNKPSPTITTYNFSINPYAYETVWFWVIIVTFLLFLTFYIVSNIAKTQRDKEIFTKEILELKLQNIQSQMNPHFIFNSLNSVIYLLQTEKYGEAEELIDDFSVILRDFLNRNNDNFIKLEEELSFIELYLSIQQKRYNNFEYQVQYSKNIGDFLIPTFLTQPIIENAILHGIAHSNKKGMVFVTAYSFWNRVVIKIDDNGIGRKRSEEINKKRENHVSKGGSLVKDKIKILERYYNTKVTTKHIDIDSDNQTGTVVIIEIYFK